MKIVVAGSSGLIGSALVEALRNEGHEVLRLVRRPSVAPTEVTWNPATGEIDIDALRGVDAFINLAGAGVGDHRWTTKYKQEILNSRVQSTDLIARTAAQVGASVLINASAIGYYGDTGTHAVTENSPAGDGFLAEVVVAWESATAPARDAGIRVVLPRTGLVVAKQGGAWKKLLPIFKLGLGGKMGSGNQYWSFITLEDEIAALLYLLQSSISGPVNLTAPEPVTNREVVRSMGKALRRPTLFPVPAFALKLVLGEFSTEILSSTRVLPNVLISNGFTFAHPDIISAMKTLR